MNNNNSWFVVVWITIITVVLLLLVWNSDRTKAQSLQGLGQKWIDV